MVTDFRRTGNSHGQPCRFLDVRERGPVPPRFVNIRPRRPIRGKAPFRPRGLGAFTMEGDFVFEFSAGGFHQPSDSPHHGADRYHGMDMRYAKSGASKSTPEATETQGEHVGRIPRFPFGGSRLTTVHCTATIAADRRSVDKKQQSIRARSFGRTSPRKAHLSGRRNTSLVRRRLRGIYRFYARNGTGRRAPRMSLAKADVLAASR